MSEELFPALGKAPDRPALRFPDRELTYGDLRRAAAAVMDGLADHERVAVWATPTAATAVAVVAALCAGRTVVPVNPKAGELELAHILGDSDPGILLYPEGSTLPEGALTRAHAPIELDVAQEFAPLPADDEAPALIVYTSGTTGPPKGAVLPRRALISNLDALAAAWEWTSADAVAHALPLFHVHGLVLGTLGPLRVGGRSHWFGPFAPEAAARAIRDGATMLFAVPTMYRRLIVAAETDASIADSLGEARLLVSGSAALPARDHAAIERLSGQRVVERYGMTETLMNTAVPARGDRRAGSVGPPLSGVEVRLVDDNGDEIPAADIKSIGEVHVKGPNLFLGYRNRRDATAEAFDGPWFRTGDLATRDGDGYLKIVGRRATDLIKSGGFKIGAGEIEDALVEHPAVADAAVTAAPDPDLGEIVVAWVVLRAGAAAKEEELVDHVARALTAHKRPRAVHFVDALPRNALGKVQKSRLAAEAR